MFWVLAELRLPTGLGRRSRFPERVVAPLPSLRAGALGTLATRRSSAGGYITACTSTSAPLASFTRFRDGAVSPETTIERSLASKREANAGTTGG
jgi:hypothetical protein